jgi:hypothetical protein
VAALAKSQGEYAAKYVRGAGRTVRTPGVDAPHIRIALVEHALVFIVAFRNLPELTDPLPVAELIAFAEVVWLVAHDTFAEVLTSTYAVETGALPQIR